MKDELLGEIKKHIDKWIGEIPFPYPRSGTEIIRFNIRAGGAGPSLEQKVMVKELESRYEILWPEIQAKLKEMRPEIDSSILNKCLNAKLLLFIPGIVNSDVFDFMLCYEFKDENTGYFFGFVDWGIVNAIKAS